MHQITCCAALVSPRIGNVIVEMSRVFMMFVIVDFYALKSASHFSLFCLSFQSFATIIMANKDFQNDWIRITIATKI